MANWHFVDYAPAPLLSISKSRRRPRKRHSSPLDHYTKEAPTRHFHPPARLHLPPLILPTLHIRPISPCGQTTVVWSSYLKLFRTTTESHQIRKHMYSQIRQRISVDSLKRLAFCHQSHPVRASRICISLSRLLQPSPHSQWHTKRSSPCRQPHVPLDRCCTVTYARANFRQACRTLCSSAPSSPY